MLPAWLRSLIDRCVPVWVRSFFSPRLHPVSYYRKRLDLLVFPAAAVNLYYFSFLFMVYRHKLVTRPDGSEFGYGPAYIQVLLLVLIVFSGYIAIRGSSVV